MSRLPRAALWIAFALAFIVVGTSSHLRLAANGLGCEPWPHCYGEPAAAEAAQRSPAAQAARLIHRIAASAFALTALGAVLAGWRQWRRPARVAGLLMLLVTAILSVVGLYTPSPLPAVTLVNVLGGLVLLGCTAFLLTTNAAWGSLRGVPRVALSALLLLLALQAAAGAMVSVRSAGAACDRGCGAPRLPGALQLWNPVQPGAADTLVRSARAGEPLHALHRLGAIVVAVVAVTLAAASTAGAGAARRLRLLGALALCVALGLALASTDGALGLAIAHALSAGILTASVAAVLAPGAGAGEGTT